MQILPVNAQNIKTESHIHRMAEIADGSGHDVVQPPAEVGSLWSGCPGSCPDSF